MRTCVGFQLDFDLKHYGKCNPKLQTTKRLRKKYVWASSLEEIRVAYHLSVGMTGE